MPLISLCNSTFLFYWRRFDCILLQNNSIGVCTNTNLVSITKCLVFGIESHHTDTIGVDLSILLGKCRDTYLLTDSAHLFRTNLPSPDRVVRFSAKEVCIEKIDVQQRNVKVERPKLLTKPLLAQR